VALLLLTTLTRTSYVKSSSPTIHVHLDGQSKLLKLQEARQTSIDYRGDSVAAEALRTGNVRPLALAAGDLDGDSAADLISSYGDGDGGLVVVRRGNLKAYQTQDQAVYQRALKGDVALSLESSADVYWVPEAPNFLAIGDFDGDHRQDLLAATIGGGLYLLAGDGAGSLLNPEQISLP